MLSRSSLSRHSTSLLFFSFSFFSPPLSLRKAGCGLMRFLEGYSALNSSSCLRAQVWEVSAVYGFYPKQLWHDGGGRERRWRGCWGGWGYCGGEQREVPGVSSGNDAPFLLVQKASLTPFKPWTLLAVRPSEDSQGWGGGRQELPLTTTALASMFSILSVVYHPVLIIYRYLLSLH